MRNTFFVVAVCLAAWMPPAMWGQAAAPGSAAQAPVKKLCTVNRLPPTPAMRALNRGEFKEAEAKLREEWKKEPENEELHEALIRALIEQDEIGEAEKEAQAWSAAHPASSMAMVAAADVRFRQGEPREAYLEYQNAARADICNARVYFNLARIDGLAGMHAAAKRLIEQAYVLNPTADDIYTWWMSTRPRKQRLALWADYAQHSDQITEENRGKLKTRLEKDALYHPSDCKAAPLSPAEATVPIVAVTDGPARFIGWGLDVQFNGKRRRLQIDTGASGITISRSAAMFLGLQREDTGKIGGIGDKGPVKSSIAHVASIKMGSLEFRNCPVEIVEKWSALDSDGLIGGDVFGDSLLTLDFPKQQLRVSPLPQRPGEKPATPSLNSLGEDEEPPPHDPYVAPEMAKWTRVYRSGHELLVPGALAPTKQLKDPNSWKDAIFLLDTGAESNLLSPLAAAKVTKVSHGADFGIRGLEGEVDKVYEAGRITLIFAGLQQSADTLQAIDLTKLAHGPGMEVSGLIGAPALFQVVMHIDYRDNLVWCEYNRSK